MLAPRPQVPSALAEGAVTETVRRVNAQAFALLRRRVEINRRIRSLHQVVHGLRDLATDFSSKVVCDPGDEARVVPERSACAPGAQQLQLEPETCDPNLSRAPAPVRMRSRPSGESRHELAAVSRACRIALMEAGNSATLDEICSRIARRGSVAFSDSRRANAAITRTLNAMSDGGEIRRVTNGSQALWQRIFSAGEIDNLQ